MLETIRNVIHSNGAWLARVTMVVVALTSGGSAAHGQFPSGINTPPAQFNNQSLQRRSGVLQPPPQSFNSIPLGNNNANTGANFSDGNFATGNSEPLSRVASNPNGSLANDQAAATETDDANAIPMRNLLQIIHDGGILMYPIAICSFVLTIFVFERLVFLRTGRIIPRPFIRRLIEQLEQQQIEPDDAIELCRRNGSPIANIAIAAVKRYGQPSVEIEQAVIDAGERETNHLRRFLRLLNGISNVTPLLGLLGTVLGMIDAFNSIATANAMGRPEALASGIGTALITTAAGLVVAIPAYLSYMYFLGRTDRLVMEMDSYAQQLVESISAESLEASAPRSRSRKRAA